MNLPGLKQGGRTSVTGRLVVSLNRWILLTPKALRPNSTRSHKVQMRIQIGILLTLFILLSPVAAKQTAAPAGGGLKITGRWRVTFSLSGDPQKNLVFDSKAKGAGTFMLLDTGPDNKPVPEPVPAAWSELSNNRVSFSGEVELPLGNCCREIGTLMFKGRFQSSTSITGKLVFVTSVDEEEAPYQFRSHIGTFSATRVD